MPRTPKRLAGPLLVDSTPETIYTVPAGTKTIVRHIHINNETDAAVSYDISIGADAAATRIVGDKSVPANDYLDIYGYFVLEAAEVIQASASADDTTTITINGDEYTAG